METFPISSKYLGLGFEIYNLVKETTWLNVYGLSLIKAGTKLFFIAMEKKKRHIVHSKSRKYVPINSK